MSTLMLLPDAQVEAGRMELEIAPFSVADELESLVDMFAAQSVDSNVDIILDLSGILKLLFVSHPSNSPFMTRKVQVVARLREDDGSYVLHVVVADNIPPIVNGDATRIRQIFSNLLSNSLKFTTKGHVLLRGWVDQSLLESAARPTNFSLNLFPSGRERVSGPMLMSAETQLVLVFEVEDSGE
jgi:signal transduction histidine kinase